MFRNQSVNVHQFAMVPKADIPRSSFRIQKTHKSTFDSGYLIPVYVDEVLPGDTFNLKMTAFCRMATPIYPVMDNLHLDSFFFFVPNRLVWSNWVRFMGEQDNPADSISYTIPQKVSPAGGYTVGSLQDYLGLPTVGQVVGGNTYTHSALLSVRIILFGISGFATRICRMAWLFLRVMGRIRLLTIRCFVVVSATIILLLVCLGFRRALRYPFLSVRLLLSRLIRPRFFGRAESVANEFGYHWRFAWCRCYYCCDGRFCCWRELADCDYADHWYLSV